MFFFDSEVLARDCVEVNGEWYIVSTLKPWDTKKWETGLRHIDTKAFFEDWFAEADDDTPPTAEEIMMYAEDYDPYGYWSVEQHPNKKVARKRHAEICKTALLQD